VVSCLPGATLHGLDGEIYRGGIKVKVGPISAAYAGTIRFVDVDHSARTLRLVARGADTRGSGDASADVALRVEQAGQGAHLHLETDLLIRGKIAQFGKGAISAVSEKVLQQFATNLGELIVTERLGPAAVTGSPNPASAPVPAASRTATAEASPPAGEAAELDGLALVVGPLLRRYGPPLALFGLGVLHGWVLGRAMTIERLYRRPADR
jgi:carbon monoxide dehydrogenase subunit G